MNKKLIALAIAGACSVPAAMAQTANPVTLYGRAYATVEWVDMKDGTPKRTRIEDQSSLFGIRGTEDLGGGLRAFFQLETAFRLDSNNSTFAARNSGVGLQGGWGSLIFGRWDMPFKSATIAVDPYGDLTLSGLTGVLSDFGNFDRREQNVAQYWSPTMGGFAFRLAGTANEGRTATSNPRSYGANATFTRGPIYAFFAWEEHRDVTATTDEEAWAAGGSFAFGPIKLGGQYQEIDKGATDIENWMGNVVWTLGKNQFIYQHLRSDQGPGDCSMDSLGYQYNFTRRTFFIASYVRVKNDDGVRCGFGTVRPLAAAAAGTDPRATFIGLRHVF
jgi:predicted porin